MSIPPQQILPPAAVDFLKCCYRFVTDVWPHENREPIPDQGFEERFRERCILHLHDWRISAPREMELGYGLQTASGTLHEIDIVAAHPDVTAIVEMKNVRRNPPGKNDVIVFYAKIIHYLCLNPDLMLKEVVPVFTACIPLEATGLPTCLGLGIHPVAPEVRPFPILLHSARCFATEMARHPEAAPELEGELEDLCAELRRLTISLDGTWFSSRFGRRSQDTIVMRAA